MAKTIKIKRSGEVFQSATEAIAFLSRTPHLPGQPVLVRYWASDTETDAILAVGTQTGFGPGTYTIVSVGGVKVISGIITSDQELPDSSELINGEIWLYQESVTHDFYWIYLYEDTREVTIVNPEINYRVFCLSDNSEYWLYGGSLEKANNYYSRDAIDRKISELTSELSETTRGLTDLVASGLQAVSEYLGGASSGYTGTVAGATNFDDADRILQSRINQATQSIQGLSNRVSDIERELTTDSEGMPYTTRIDTLYSWYDEVTHAPKGTIEILDPEGPIIQNSMVTVKVIYRWSWADHGSWLGLRLNYGVKPFGVNDVAGANIPEGYYEWITDISVGTEPVTIEASFEGSGLDPVTYVLKPEPIKQNIEISWPTQGWNAHQYTYVVKFEGSGLPASWAGNELSVTQSSKKVFQVAETDRPTQSTTYTGTLTSGALINASWSPIMSEVYIRPTYLIVLPKDTPVTTESLEASEKTWVSYQEAALFETPEITFGPDQTFVILSPHDLSDSKIQCVSGQSEPLIVTSDFTSPDTILYHEVTYNYVSFPKIGAGTFKFILT